MNNMRDAESTMKSFVVQLDGLKAQAQMQRIPVSQAIRELKAYIDKQHQNDKLLYPDGENPFKAKKRCNIL